MSALDFSLLRVAIGRLLCAATDPQCRRSLGPRATGATTPGGARVPGTCFELTPAEATADIARLLCWPAAPDASAVALAQQLAQADAQARAAVLAGDTPMTMGELMRQIHAVGLSQGSWMQRPAVAAEPAAVAVLFDDAQQLAQMPVQRFVAALVRH